MRVLSAFLALLVLAASAAPASAYYYRGAYYPYRWRGHYYRYHHHGGYYAHRRCYWSYGRYVCRYY
jgi:hypothetical protein